MLYISAVEKLLLLLLPCRNLIYASSGIFVERNVILFDKLGIVGLYVEAVVLCVMLRAFGTEISESLNVVEANHVVMLALFVHFCGTAADFGVKVVAVLVANLKEPAHMVDACDKLLANIVLIHAELIQKTRRTALNAMAESYGLNTGVTLHEAGKHCHGVCVIEEKCVRTNLFYVGGKALENMNCAQRSEYAAYSHGIAYRLAQTVLLRNLEVYYRAGVITAYLYCVNNESCASESVLSLLNAEIFLYNGLVVVILFVYRLDNDVRLVKPRCVDVIKCNFALTERLRKKRVTEYVLCKNGTSGAHKCNFKHGLLLFRHRVLSFFDCVRRQNLFFYIIARMFTFVNRKM